MDAILERADVQAVANKLLSAEQAAKSANVNRLTIYRWVASGELPVITTASGLRVWAPDLESFMVRRRHTADGRSQLAR